MPDEAPAGLEEPLLEACQRPILNRKGESEPAQRPGEQVLNRPLQYLVGREPDGVRHASLLQCLVQSGERKGGIGTDDDGLPPGSGPVNDGQEDLVPAVRTVDVALGYEGKSDRQANRDEPTGTKDVGDLRGCHFVPNWCVSVGLPHSSFIARLGLPRRAPPLGASESTVLQTRDR